MTCYCDADYYPAGAANDPNAPYNQVEPKPETFNVDVSFELYRTADVESDNYSFAPFDDTPRYEGSANEDFCVQYFSPLEMLKDYAELCKVELAKAKKNHDQRAADVWRLKIASATGWEME